MIEFVETENYNLDHINEILYGFLQDVRAVGCQIAVDDFGVGFATYTSIVSLRPNIIKIDGDIIRGLADSTEKQLIVDSICYMARLIGAKIVAEFVENADIQNVVEQNKIHFSQGYHFAKPVPLSSLFTGDMC